MNLCKVKNIRLDEAKPRSRGDEPVKGDEKMTSEDKTPLTRG